MKMKNRVMLEKESEKNKTRRMVDEWVRSGVRTTLGGSLVKGGEGI